MGDKPLDSKHVGRCKMAVFKPLGKFPPISLQVGFKSKASGKWVNTDVRLYPNDVETLNSICEWFMNNFDYDNDGKLKLKK